jgi:hypothetical protein
METGIPKAYNEDQECRFLNKEEDQFIDRELVHDLVESINQKCSIQPPVPSPAFSVAMESKCTWDRKAASVSLPGQSFLARASCQPTAKAFFSLWKFSSFSVD